MLMAYLTLFSGLFISAVAIYYSVSGLTAIFAASVIPIVIMGTSLEVGKLVASVWLKQNWSRAPKLLRGYLISAVAILMLITSMGIFGYLSKAHTDQSLVSGDVQSKIAVYDEKIKTEKDNIDANRKAFKQMDEAVDQVMARSTTEGGADKAVAIRRSQQKERSRLTAEIGESQKKISAITEQRAPIAAEVRKVEAEVGPIKYIAAFIYGDDPDQNILDKAVRWVIILIVIVFDPLAVILLLASQYSFEYERKKDEDEEEFFDRAREVAQSIDDSTYVSTIYPPTGPITSWTTTTYEPDDGALTDEQIDVIRKAAEAELPTGEVVNKTSLFEDPEPDEELPVVKHRFAGFPWVFNASYNQPNVHDEHPLEEAEIAEPTIESVKEEPILITRIAHPESNSNYNTSMDERPGDYVEPPKPAPTKRLEASIVDSQYVNVNGQVYHHKAYDAKSRNSQDIVDRIKSTYVQNEEQAESGVWSKIAGNPITEEEYLDAARRRQYKENDK